MHLLQLMTPWAIVCDGWCLEPQNLKPRDTPIQFAERVRDIIFVREGLKKVIRDGFLKYSRPRPNHRERKYLNKKFITQYKPTIAAYFLTEEMQFEEPKQGAMEEVRPLKS